MSNENPINSAITNVQKGVADAGDAAKETLHRGAADAEKSRRDVAGDEMTTGEKIKSGATELKERAAAEGDHAKRTIRDNT